MKRYALFMIATCLLAIFPIWALAASVGKFTHVEGQVDVLSPGQAARAAKLGDEVSVGETLRTKSQSKAEVTFDDGNILRLAEKTAMEIKEYMVSQDRSSGILSLSRGKIQNIIKAAAGRIFGQDKENRFEVHTPTAVIGVRGTDFFSYYLKGVSGAIFQEGTGYGYNVNKPEEVKTISAGQAMVVAGPDKVPVIKPATDVEIKQHINDTAPSEKPEGKKEDGSPVTGAEPWLFLAETGYAESDLELESVGTGETPGPSGTIVVDIPPPITSLASLGVDFTAKLNLDFLESGTMSGSFSETSGMSNVSVSGTLMEGTPETAHHGDLSGTMSDGSAFAGYLGGVVGSWNAVFSSLYAREGNIGYFYGDLSGIMDSENLTLSASGTVYRTPVYGSTMLVPGEEETLADALFRAMRDDLFDSARLPIISSLDMSTGNVEGTAYSSDSLGITTSSGRVLGIWRAITRDGFFSNPSAQSSSTFLYGQYGMSDYYMLGQVSASDDLNGHAAINGSLTYMDARFMGDFSLWYHGSYVSSYSSYSSAGVGTFTLDPLAYTGYWNSPPGGCIYSNGSGNFVWVGADYGILGGLKAPWDNDSSPFLAMGNYGASVSSGHLLWNTTVFGWDPDDQQTGFTGFAGGIWKNDTATYGTQYGNLAAIYMTHDGRAGLLTSSDLSGYHYPGLSMWKVDGTLLRDPRTTVSNPADYEIYTGSMDGNLVGGYGPSSAIYGWSSSGSSSTLFFKDYVTLNSLPWGIYDLKLGNGNYFEGKPAGLASWSAVSGGQGTFGYTETGGEQSGYWIAPVTGTWTEDGEIRGSLSGTYLTLSQTGSLGGSFIGVNAVNNGTGSGTWIGQSVGTFEGQPLAFSGETMGQLIYFSGSRLYGAGYGSGLLGGTALTLFSGTPTTLTLMGVYDDYGYAQGRPLLMYGSGFDFQGGSLAGVSPTNEAFHGYMVGIWRDGSINAKVRSLSIGSNGDAGYLKGDVDGSYYPGINMWMASGLLTAQPVETTTVDPSTLASSVMKEHFEGFKGHGSFEGGGSLSMVIDEEGPPMALGDPIHIDGHNWGVWNAAFGGTYSGQTSGSWNFKTGGYYTLDPQVYYLTDQNSNGYWLGEITGTAWGDPDIFGTYEARAMTADGIYQFTGDTLGSRVKTGESGDWQAAGIGTYTRRPLLFSSDFRYKDPGDSYSGPFKTYRLANGTSYEGSFGISMYNEGQVFVDYHYDYEYFISSVYDKVFYGEWWRDEKDPYESREWGEIFVPNGTIYAFSQSKYPSFTPFRRTGFGEWVVGTVDPSYFSNSPIEGLPREWYGERPANALAESGVITGIMGGTDDIWAVIHDKPAAVPISLMGRYEPSWGTSYGQPSLFGVEIKQSEATTGGAYTGYLGGVIDDVEGALYTIFIAGNADGAPYKGGILAGGFAGNVYPDLGMWEASGTIYPIVMANDIQVAPADLGSNLDEGFIAGWVAGDFGSQDSLISGKLGWGNTLALRGHGDWGVFGLFFGYDNKAKNPQGSSTWSARAGGWADFGTHPVIEGDPLPDIGMWLTSLMNGTAANGMLRADFPGNFLTYSKYGKITGKTIGSYDTANENWQAMAAGYWHESRPLAFNGLFQGETARMVESYGGHWDNGVAGSYYDYSYDTGANTGWSRKYEAVDLTTTQTEYGPDGTFRKWQDANGILSYEEGTWAGTLLNTMRTNSPGTPSEYGPNYFLEHRGWLSGVMGGLSDLWSANASARAQIRFIGEYDKGKNAGAHAVFSTPIGSYNPYDGSPTIWNQADNSQNGAYYGFMAGRGLGDDMAEGMILALGLDKSGNAHLVKGIFGASLYPDLEMWEGTGFIFPMEIVPDTFYDAAQLYPDSLLHISSDQGPMEATGQFTDSPAGVINWLSYDRERAYIYDPGQTWRLGVSSLTFGGTYAPGMGSDLNYWFREWDYRDDPSVGSMGAFVSAPDAPGAWSNGLISAKGFEAWVNWNDAVTGISGADLKGTFDPTNKTWQAVALWAWMDTGTFMNLASNAQGREKLNALNIPCIEVGKDTLTGRGGYTGTMTVNMVDTTFFAYSTGARPRIWASGNVNGSGSAGVMEIGSSVPLQGQTISDLRADFAMRSWNASKWTANINNGSGTVGGHAIGFGGAAAGTHPGDGSFTGTASGVAGPPTPVD